MGEPAPRRILIGAPLWGNGALPWRRHGDPSVHTGHSLVGGPCAPSKTAGRLVRTHWAPPRDTPSALLGGSERTGATVLPVCVVPNRPPAPRACVDPVCAGVRPHPALVSAPSLRRRRPRVYAGVCPESQVVSHRWVPSHLCAYVRLEMAGCLGVIFSETHTNPAVSGLA